MSQNETTFRERTSQLMENPKADVIATTAVVAAEGFTVGILVEQGMADPKYAVIAGAIAVALTVGDSLKQYYERNPILGKNTKTLELADPDMVKIGQKPNRKVSHLDRLAHLAGIGLIFFGGIQLSHPESSSATSSQSTELVFNATDYQNATGTADGGTRLIDGINGGLQEAAVTSTPFTFILDGSTAQNAGTTTGGNNINQVASSINRLITPDFQNANIDQTFADGIIAAENAASGNANKIIIIDSSLTTDEITTLNNLKKQTKYSADIYGIVVGNGSANTSIGSQTLTSNADPTGFIQALGQNNVATANTATQVTADIKSFNSAKVVVKHKHVAEWPLQVAAGSALLGAVVSSRRRLSGIYKQTRLRISNRKGDK